MHEMLSPCRPTFSHRRTSRLPRSVRPSLIDLRFTGDPWVVDHCDGTASVRLDNYPLARLEMLPLDLPALNSTLAALRLWEARRAFYRARRRLGV